MQLWGLLSVQLSSRIERYLLSKQTGFKWYDYFCHFAISFVSYFWWSLPPKTDWDHPSREDRSADMLYLTSCSLSSLPAIPPGGPGTSVTILIRDWSSLNCPGMPLGGTVFGHTAGQCQTGASFLWAGITELALVVCDVQQTRN